MKKLLSLLTVFTAVVCTMAADLPMCNYYRFDTRPWLTGSGAAKGKITLMPDMKYAGHGSVKLVHEGSKSSFYSGFRVAASPGTMQIKFNIKSDVAGDGLLAVNFNRPGGRNGSAGYWRSNFQTTGEWQQMEFILDVPENVAGLQFVFSFSGKANTIYLNNLYFGYAPDIVVVPVVEKVNFKAPLTRRDWNPKQRVAAFYKLGKLAKISPEVQVAADKEALYLAFVNPTPAVKTAFAATTRDESLWLDDCNEIFLFNPAINKGWHFVVNANGARYDAQVYQKQDGDPWRDNPAWNGKNFAAYTQKTANGWNCFMKIAWADLEVMPQDGLELGVNIASENKDIREDATWNCTDGKFHEPTKYGKLIIKDGKMQLIRSRKMENFTYTVKRPAPKFDELLEKGVPGDFLIGAWSSGADVGGFSKQLISKVGMQGFYRWQNDLMHAYGKAHMFGPALPWLPNYLAGGPKFQSKEKMYEFNKIYGMKYPWSIHSSAHDRKSRERGAKYILARDSRKVSPIDPILIDMMTNQIRNLPSDRNYPLYKMTSFVMGMDEPFNGYTEIFSRTLNSKNADALDELSEKIKKEYGAGKYGLFDDFGADDPDIAFKRIASCRWINAEFFRANQVWKAELAKVLPGVPFKMGTNNTCGGLAPLDYAMYDGYADILAVDPYPTSAKYNFGGARAIYHTGFSTRMLNDLAPRVRTLVMPQAFIYCSGRPEPSDLREWASQALKNGADGLMWYCSNAQNDLFECFLEMFAINKFVAKMDKVKMPQNPDTAIFFSTYDNYALRDNVVNAAYTIYSILGEQLKGNFRFVSTTTLARDLDKLENYKLVYVPRLTYTDPALTAKLVNYVRQGGTLVVFDPRFLSWNTDGSAVPERAMLTGVEKITPRAAAKTIKLGSLEVPLTANVHIKIPTGMQVESYAASGVTGQFYGRYADSSIAAVQQNLGKGKVIYFLSQPFGNADLAIDGGNWKKFFTNLAKQSGCRLNLPIWDFTLPADRLEKIELKQLK